MMPARKDIWISANEAAEIMTKNSGHPIHPDYVRLISRQGKIRSRVKDGRTKEYHKGDSEGYVVRGNKPKSEKESDAA